MLAGEGSSGGEGSWGSLKDDGAAVVTSCGANVDDVVRMGDDGLMVFDAEHSGAGIDQLVEQGEELLNIGQVQACGGFVEDVGSAGFSHVGGEFDALTLAAGESREGLTEGDVAQAHIDQALQDFGGGGQLGVFGAEEGEASAAERARTSPMFLSPRRYSSTPGEKRLPSQASQTAVDFSMKPSWVSITPVPLHSGQAPSELAEKRAGLTPLALAKALRMGSSRPV